MKAEEASIITHAGLAGHEDICVITRLDLARLAWHAASAEGEEIMPFPGAAGTIAGMIPPGLSAMTTVIGKHGHVPAADDSCPPGASEEERGDWHRRLAEARDVIAGVLAIIDEEAGSALPQPGHGLRDRNRERSLRECPGHGHVRAVTGTEARRAGPPREEAWNRHRSTSRRARRSRCSARPASGASCSGQRSCAGS